MKPPAPYDPEHRPNVGSKLTLKPRKDDGKPVEAILEGYLPGRVWGQGGAGHGHRNILVRVAGVPIKTNTTQISRVEWHAPLPTAKVSQEQKRRRAEALAAAERAPEPGPSVPEVIIDSPFEFADLVTPGYRSESILNRWLADNEDENGDLPADTPAHPGIDALHQIAVSERLADGPRPRPRSYYSGPAKGLHRP